MAASPAAISVFFVFVNRFDVLVNCLFQKLCFYASFVLQFKHTIMLQVIASIVYRLALLISFLLFQHNIIAQVQVVVNVVPPYSTLAKDYLQQGSNVMVTVINISYT
jgi:hypothetical protein